MNEIKNFLRRRIVARILSASALIGMMLVAMAHCNAQFAQDFHAQVPNNGFPAHTEFDPNVQPADLIVENTSQQQFQQAAHQDTPNAIVGSTSEMLSNWSSSVKEQWTDGNWNEKVGSYFKNIDVGRMLGSLAIVLGGYFGLVWFSRQFGGRSGQVPSDVLEVLGQVPFGPKKHLQIVRLGSKLLLLINGPEGTHPIGEITDPNEVEYLASLFCPGKKKTSGARALSIAKAAMSRNTSPTVNISSNTVPQPGSTMAPNVASTTNPNHLAAILESLNGQSGNAAVFEA